MLSKELIIRLDSTQFLFSILCHMITKKLLRINYSIPPLEHERGMKTCDLCDL